MVDLILPILIVYTGCCCGLFWDWASNLRNQKGLFEHVICYMGLIIAHIVLVSLIFLFIAPYIPR